ncbi:sporulation integral membrane protein YlbJ [Brevibacillus choshinensis]|uniref:Sporulation integral membrane protein YlbJ n=1 Tax=Brevibacillus choshinensis TaxID=54911 RepID=A0ABX7FH72_BRECH|nr:sporulation integral membrane protein YlbJ [Brevibacillus choshinensis]QRG65554.1 sporulation integral membrane protein YlbJ [Brevibacillus choshinensis]
MSRHSPIFTLLFAFSTIALVFALVAYSQISFEAAVRGLKIWWEVVFPSTLPFIVLSEILMGLGVVHFVGVLLEPLMRPLFNVPGTGGFVLAMGFSSGYPVAAKLTTRLRQQGNVTQAEGERLVSFTTTGDPLFVMGAVAIGFFHSEQMGLVLALTHYLSAVIMGLLYRFHAPFAVVSKPLEKTDQPLPLRALQAMHRARLRDGRPFGKLMGDAVHSALNTLFMIGGFIIVFSVLIQLFSAIHLTQIISTFLSIFLVPFGFPPAFSHAIVAGLFEVTLGAQAASAVPDGVSMVWKAAIASAILSWGGLSVHAQVASILSETDIRVAPYLLARSLHAIAAAILTFILWGPLHTSAWLSEKTIPVFLPSTSEIPLIGWWDTFWHSSLLALGVAVLLLLASVLFRRIRPNRMR